MSASEQAPSRWSWVAQICSFRWQLLLLGLWLLTLVRDTLSNGDAATYLTQIRDLDFLLRTLHIGYFLSATPFVRILPLPPALCLNLVSLGWTLLGVWSLRRIAKIVDVSPGWAVLWCVACPPVLSAATTAEVYPGQLALILWALAAWGEDRPNRAGALFFLSMTFSPTSLVALPVFAYRRASTEAWTRLLACSVVPMGILIWAFSGDYLWGPRGILMAPEGLSPTQALFFRLEALPSTFAFGLLFLAPGIAVAVAGLWPQGRRLLVAMAAHAILVCLVADRYRDVPAQGLAVVLLALFAAQGTQLWLTWGRKAIGPRVIIWVLGCLLVQCVLADQSVRHQRRKEASFATLARRVYATLSPGERVVGTFSERRLYEWYAVGRAPAGHTSPFEALSHVTGGSYCFLNVPDHSMLPSGAGLRAKADGSWAYVPPTPAKGRDVKNP